MNQVCLPAQIEAARTLRRALATYSQNRDFLAVGAYQAGSNAELDRVLANLPSLQEFLRQDWHAKVSMEQSLRDLNEVAALLSRDHRQ
jgi:flagellum-specific ATP synthase